MDSPRVVGALSHLSRANIKAISRNPQRTLKDPGSPAKPRPEVRSRIASSTSSGVCRSADDAAEVGRDLRHVGGLDRDKAHQYFRRRSWFSRRYREGGGIVPDQDPTPQKPGPDQVPPPPVNRVPAITAVEGNGVAVERDDANVNAYFTAGAEVVIKATGGKPPITLFNVSNRDKPEEVSGGADNTWTLKGDDRKGTFQAKDSSEPPEESNAITVAGIPSNRSEESTSSAGPKVPEEPPSGVAEVAPGQYDQRFAVGVGLLFVLAALALVTLVFRVVDWLPDSSELVNQADVSQTDGTSAPSESLAEFRLAIVACVAILAIGFGGVVLLSGAGMAALETRGRLWLRKPSGQPEPEDDAEPGGRGWTKLAELGPEMLEAVKKVIDSGKLVRGAALVVMAGVAVILASLIVVSCQARTDPISDPNGGSASPTPSASPSGSQPAPQATDGTAPADATSVAATPAPSGS